MKCNCGKEIALPSKMPNGGDPCGVEGIDGSVITGTGRYDSAGTGFQEVFGVCAVCLQKSNDAYECALSSLQ